MYCLNNPELLQLFLEHTPVAIAILDCNLRYICTSQKWLQQYSVTASDVTGLAYDQVCPYPQRWQEQHLDCLAGATLSCAADTLVYPDGKIDWVKWECHPWYEENGAIGGLVLFTELISNHQQPETANWQKLAANVPGVIYQFLMRPDGFVAFPYLSPACWCIFELAPETVQADVSLIYELVHPDDRESHQNSILTSAQTLQAWVWEGRIITPSGQLKWIRAVSQPEQQSNGDIIWDGLIIDITDRVQVEAQLHLYQEHLEELVSDRTQKLADTNARLQAEILERQQAEAIIKHREQQLQLALKAARMGFWEWDITTDKVTWSQQTELLFDLGPGFFKGSYTDFINCIHPEDREITNSTITRAWQDKCNYELDHRVLLADSQVRWLRCWGDILENESGEVVGLTGTIMDITHAKQAQEALRASEARFQRIAANLPGIIYQYVLHPDGSHHIPYISPGCRDLYELAPEVIMEDANQVFSLIHPDDLSNFQESILVSAQTLQPWSLEGRIITPSGRVKWLQGVARPEVQSNGDIVWDGLIFDVTKRKQAEAEVAQQTQTLRAIVDHAPIWIWMTNTNNKLYLGNKTLCEDLGIKESKLIRANQYYDVLSPETAHLCQASDWACWAAQTPIFTEEKLLFADGQYHTMEVIKTQLRNPTGEVIGLIGLAVDASARKQAEAELWQSKVRLREQVQQQKLIQRLSQQIRNTLDLDTILQTAVQEIRSLFAIECCSFAWYYAHPDSSYWDIIKKDCSPGIPTCLGRYPANNFGEFAQQLLRMEMLRVDDVAQVQDQVWREFVGDNLGIVSILVVPIRSRSATFGAISCSNSKTPKQWSDREVELLQAVTAQLAIAINQAELYTESKQAAITAQNQATQLEQTLQQLRRTQTQLVQSEKMSSLGQLVAGVAHEINNPVTFISGNLIHASDYMRKILRLLQLYQQQYPQSTPEIQQAIASIELDFITADLPKLLSSMQVGAERICQIIQSLRNFSRIDQAAIKRVDIHEGIESTLMILQHRLKASPKHSGIEIIKNYGNLPLIECYPGQFNQVLMNLLSNAIDAIQEQSDRIKATEKIAYPGIIRITTEITNAQDVIIRIVDNGIGIPPKIKKRIFDPFFTTKPVGVGTGLGLSISYQIIVDKHHGQLRCYSEVGKGTEFIIQIPLQQK